MNAFGLDFHHLGLAVREPAAAMTFLQGLGYRLGDPVYDPEQNVNLAMCTAGDAPDVEIIWPAAGKGPVDRLLANRSGLVYHVCYATDDLPGSLRRMEDAGHRAVPLAPPKPAVLFDGMPVSFYEIVGFGTVEIIDRASAPTPATDSASG